MKDTLDTTYRSRLIHRAKTYRIVRQAVLAAGIVSTMLGIIGIFIPVLPTTPFLLLAGACFAFSSKRAYTWLMNNRWFGNYLRNYSEGRGLTARVKILSISMMWVTIGFSIIYIVPQLTLKAGLLLIAIAVTAHILMRPTYTGD